MIYQPLDVQPFDPANHAATAAERRKRLMGRPPAKNPSLPAPKPAQRIEYVHFFDSHVICWREHLARENGTPVDYVKARCRELGLAYLDIIGTSRFREHTRARQMFMWELHQRTPRLSLTQIGKALGGRDHTTVLHGVRQHAKRIGEGGD